MAAAAGHKPRKNAAAAPTSPAAAAAAAAAATWGYAHLVNGELVITISSSKDSDDDDDDDDDDDSKDAKKRRVMKREEVIFIIDSTNKKLDNKNDNGSTDEGCCHHYLMYCLITEASPSGSNDKNGTTSKKSPNPFELGVFYFAGDRLPEGWSDLLLLGGDDDDGLLLPRHLNPGRHNQVVHVVISTRSGTCQAQQFFDSVLQPLLGLLLGGAAANGKKTSSPSYVPSPPPPPPPTTTTTKKRKGKRGLNNNTLSLLFCRCWPSISKKSDEPAKNGGEQRVVKEEDGIYEETNEYQVLVTKDANTVREFGNELGHDMVSRQGTSRTVVLLSGDGGVVDLVNGLVRADLDAVDTRLTVGLLPLGTGNALFHSLHRQQYVKEKGEVSPLVLGLRTLFRGKAAPLPTFKAEFSKGARLVEAGEHVLPAPAPDGGGDELEEGDEQKRENGGAHERGNREIDSLVGAIVASYGFHASLVWESDTPEYRVHGDKRFGMAAEQLLKESHAYNATVEMVHKTGRGGEDAKDGAMIKLDGDRFNYVLTTMVSNLERTFTISPASRPLDGQLRLVHFGDVGGKKTMDIMMAAYNGGAHVGMRWPSGASATTAARMEEEVTGRVNGHAEEQRQQQQEEPEEETQGVGYDEADLVRVTVHESDPRWRKFCIDGTIVEVPQGGSMTVRRSTRVDTLLKVLVDPAVIT